MAAIGIATSELRFDYYHVSGGMLIVAKHAGECGCCHTARYAFINRNGRSLCISCDMRARKANAALAHGLCGGHCA
jgi:hypothetical protein